MPVIDVDIHLAERPGDLVPYLDLPWRRAVAEPEPNPPWSLGGALHPRLGEAPVTPEPARAPAALIAHLDGAGIAACVALPGPLLKIGALPTAPYAAALMRAYNRWLVETWLDGGRIHGALLMAPQDPAGAADEMRRYASRPGVVAALLPMGGTDPLWGDRRYDPIYAAATETGLPVVLHGGGDLLLPGTPSLPTQFASGFEQRAMSAPLVAMANLVQMTGTGLFARFPALRCLFLEAGLSWFTHIALRMDKEYNENRRDIPHYRERVSAYLKRQVWLGTHPIEAARRPGDLRAMVAISLGADQIVYGSHWPFADADAPDHVAAAFVDDAERAGVMGGNAAAFFGIRVPAAERAGAD